MEVLNFPTQFKALDQDGPGTFQGLAACYGNIDLGGDVLAPGCFKKIEFTESGGVRLLDQHQHHRPIGQASVTETREGLAIKGRLNLAVSYAKDCYELIKDKTLSGLSIGFNVLDGGAERKSDGTRLLSRLQLWEVSCVTFPMNQSARIASVKSATSCADIRGFETLLKGIGFSNRESKRLASRGWTGLSDNELTEAELVAEKLTELERLLKGES